MQKHLLNIYWPFEFMYLTCPPLQCLSLCETMTFNVVIMWNFLIYVASCLRKCDNVMETFLTEKIINAFFISVPLKRQFFFNYFFKSQFISIPIVESIEEQGCLLMIPGCKHLLAVYMLNSRIYLIGLFSQPPMGKVTMSNNPEWYFVWIRNRTF